MITWRDLLWLAVALIVSSGASATLATAVITQSRTLLDLPWLVIAGSVGLAMFGGLVGTLFVLHSAAEKKMAVNVPLQVMLDLGRAAVLGIAAYAVVVLQGWDAEVLLGILPLLGVAGQKVLDPAVAALAAGAKLVVDRVAGKGKE